MKTNILVVVALLTAVVAVGGGGVAQSGEGRLRSTVVGFYNVENLFDTIPSPFYDDSDYTPSGRLGWNGVRYRAKIDALAAVIDRVGADVMGLAEVENEAVVRDLTSALQTDCCYIHRTTSDSRGIDVALIYRGDRFFPERTVQIDCGTSREALYVTGELRGRKVGVLVWHAPSKLNDYDRRKDAMLQLRRVVDSLRLVEPERGLIVMGDMNAAPDDSSFRLAFGRSRGGVFAASGFVSPVMTNKSVAGSYCSNHRWYLFDNILLDNRLAESFDSVAGGVVVDAATIAEGRNGAVPRRTFEGGSYVGGASDHLPVYAIMIDRRE